MKIYISTKYDPDIFPVIAGIRQVIKNLGYESYSFIEEGKFTTEQDMMEKALKAIDQSDVILLECSRPAFGVGIEGGYAYAKKKRIIAVAAEGISFSKTIKGISEATINYQDFTNLEKRLGEKLIK